MSLLYPLPREIRETDVLVGDGGATYGPFGFKVFDVVDVVVMLKKADEEIYTEAEVTVTKTDAAELDTFSIEFAEDITEDDSFVVLSRRLHERLVSVMRGGAISGQQLDKELSKQASVIQELRRDVDRSLRFGVGFDGSAELPLLGDAQTFVWSEEENRFIPGPTTAELLVAERHAETAKQWAIRPEDDPVPAEYGGDGETDFSSLHHAVKSGTAAEAAGDRAGYAAEWAYKPEDDPVSEAAGGDGATTFSARHYAQKAAAAAMLIPTPQPGDEDKVLHVKSDLSGAEWRPPVVGDVLDFVQEYSVTLYTSKSLAIDGTDYTDAWNDAVARCATERKRMRIRGFFDGTTGYFYVGTRGLPIPVDLVVDGDVEMVFPSGAGDCLTTNVRTRIEGRLTIDGGNDNDAVLGGYVAGQNGVYIGAQALGSGSPTIIEGVEIHGLKIKNCGDTGLHTQYLDDPVFRDIITERCGMGGSIHYSVRGGSQKGGRSWTIFPGLPLGSNWAHSTSYTAGTSFAIDETTGFNYKCLVTHTSAGSGTFAAARAANPSYWEVYSLRNAYGVGATQYGAHRQSEGFDFAEIWIKGVPTWEGADIHSGKNITFDRLLIEGCATGIAAENHISGIRMQGISIVNCRIYGFGTSTTKDGMTCYSMGGVIVNASGTFDTYDTTIALNRIQSCGEGRPGITGGGGIAFRHGRMVVIEGNVIFVPYQSGIVMPATNSTTDAISGALVNGNNIESVQSHASVQKGLNIGQYAQGAARGNYVKTSGISSANAYSKVASGYDFAFGTIGQVSSPTTQYDNLYLA